MIQWYEASPSFVELDEQLSRARGLAPRDPSQAIGELMRGMHDIHANEESWQRGALLLYELLQRAGLAEEALTLAWYLDDPVLARPLMKLVKANDRARTWSGQAALGLVPRDAEALLYERAAAEFEAAELPVHAAVSYERAGRTEAARTLWSRLAGRLAKEKDRAYATGLVLFNLARNCQKLAEADRTRTATTSAVQHLEQAADHFESIGQRERAFDCYHVLVAIGEQTHTFEHVLEGSVNAIRILREDHLAHHALRLYAHSSELAEAYAEPFAAATLAREMTDYARHQALNQVAEFGLVEQARLWQSVADKLLEDRAASDLVEAALRQCLLVNAELHQYATMAELYARLEKTTDSEQRQQRYKSGNQRCAASSNRQGLTRDSGLGKPHPPPEIWFDDLLEWEDAGSANARCSEIILDPRGADDRTTRRAAVLGRLAALATSKASAGSVDAHEMLARHLAPIGLYETLAALEALFEHPAPSVRMLVVRAVGRHAYKRSFLTLERALGDPEASVRDTAAEEIRRQRFEHAFDPLARLYRHSSYGPARLAALQALAHLDLTEASDLVLGALEHGTLAEAEAASEALIQSRSQRFLHAARARLPTASPELARAIHRVLRARGEHLPGP